jgi:hypothetical protein
MMIVWASSPASSPASTPAPTTNLTTNAHLYRQCEWGHAAHVYAMRARPKVARTYMCVRAATMPRVLANIVATYAANTTTYMDDDLNEPAYQTLLQYYLDSYACRLPCCITPQFNADFDGDEVTDLFLE